MNSHVNKLLERLPDAPGIYLMYNEKEELIYVGKAKNLKKRVHSYFRNQKKHAAKVARMVTEVTKFSYVTVKNELEALVLETNYIKENRPKYNILMRDDKHHLYIKISTNEEYPRVYTTRKVLNDGALYFGPKTSSKSVYSTLKLLRKLFPYRTCTLDIRNTETGVEVTKKTISYPCIYYHIKRCIGPCIIKCPDEYGEIIEHVIQFLKGEYKEILHSLSIKMKNYAESRNYEKAAETRDIIFSIEHMMEKQHADLASNIPSIDSIGIVRKFGKIFVSVFQIRQGKVIGHENFTFSDDTDGVITKDETQRLITHCLMQYYTAATDLPKEILVQEIPAEKLILETWFKEDKNQTIALTNPKRGSKLHLLSLALDNAESFADQKKVEWMRDTAKTKGAAADLAKYLKISTPLHRIECYDISHLGGTSTVASMVVFKNGEPSQKDYRRFKLKTLQEGEIDDFRSLQEILERRFKRLSQKELKEGESFAERPDLIVIDGGKGQLSHVMEVAKTYGIDIPIISLAKREEEIFIPGVTRPLILPRESFALYLMQNIRDEAHRFAISYNRNLRSKKMKRSILDEIKGIGPKMKKKLLTTFGDLRGIESASMEEVAAVVGQKVAKSIKEYL